METGAPPTYTHRWKAIPVQCMSEVFQREEFLKRAHDRTFQAWTSMNDDYSWCEWCIQLVWMMATFDWMMAKGYMNDGYSWCVNDGYSWHVYDGYNYYEWWLHLKLMMATIYKNVDYGWYERWFQFMWMMTTVDMIDGYSRCEWWLQLMWMMYTVQNYNECLL